MALTKCVLPTPLGPYRKNGLKALLPGLSAMLSPTLRESLLLPPSTKFSNVQRRLSCESSGGIFACVCCGVTRYRLISFSFGVTNIGLGAVVAAGAVCVENVPAGAVVAGVPARVIKMRDEKTDSKTGLEEGLRQL